MAIQQTSLGQDEMLASRKAMWSGFVRLSTYSIVGVSIVLILLAVAFV